MKWTGVISALTTAFKPDYGVDHAFVARHAKWQIENGCDGIVAPGSLGESATLTFEEKIAILNTLAKAIGAKRVVASIAALSTVEAVALARAAQRAGCAGLMVLPPYVYSSDWREMKAHVLAVLRATRLSCMLYNNPPAYKTDFLPGQIAELATEHANLRAVKESSGDVRRVTALKALCGERLALFVGLDDVVVEGLRGPRLVLAGAERREALATIKARVRKTQHGTPRAGAVGQGRQRAQPRREPHHGADGYPRGEGAPDRGDVGDLSRKSLLRRGPDADPGGRAGAREAQLRSQPAPRWRYARSRVRPTRWRARSA